MKRLALALLLGTLPLAPEALAYKTFAHERLTREALTYIRGHAALHQRAAAWILGDPLVERMIDETLVRSNVDMDYRSDIWFRAALHPPFAGVMNDGWINVFSTLTHFMNITKPGKYWAFDGYSFDGSTQQGKDKLLDLPTLRLLVNQSPPFGGEQNSVHPSDMSLGELNVGFTGSRRDWAELYRPGQRPSKVVFPPASASAEIALTLLLRSPQATASRTESWTEGLEVASGALDVKTLRRPFWRGEIEGLPKRFDLLGVALHMLQDLTVPQHVLGTSDLCHHQYEFAVDTQACSGQAVDYAPYHNGTYSGDRAPHCRALYREDQVDAYLRDLRSMDGATPETLTERMIEIARQSARLQLSGSERWGVRATLPSGKVLKFSSCEALGRHPEIQAQIVEHFNLGVAASIMALDLAATQYGSGS